MLLPALEAYVGTDRLATKYLDEVAWSIHVEDDDRQVVLTAHRGGRQVHDLEPSIIDLIISDPVELSSRGVLLWVGGIDPVDTCPLEHHIGFEFDPTQG